MRKKILAFKSSNQKDNTKTEESDEEDKDLSLIIRKFRSFLQMKKKKQARKKASTKGELN